MFGIADSITVESIKDSQVNMFCMNYTNMKESGGKYYPEQIKVNETSDLPNGTTVELRDIKRKSDFDPIALAESLSKRFSIFDKLKVEIYYNGNHSVNVEPKSLHDGIECQFEWKLPEDFEGKVDDVDYFKNNNIYGYLKTANTPLKKLQQGVTLLARQKLVQENAYFDDRSNDYFHSYLYGVVNVDFIDEDNSDDHVSTDRRSLIWEGEMLEELKSNLNEVLNYVSRDWRKKREIAKKEKFKTNHGVDIDSWLDGLSAAEKPLAKTISGAILNNSKLDEDRSASLFQHIQDVFSLQGFQDFAESLNNVGALDEENAIKLLEDWQFIEAKEMAKLSDGRINTINQFEKYIQENVSETKVMQKFLDKFPWILDPRMTTFEREFTYSKWLKEQFDEDGLDESNKRIDFLCSNNNGIVHIIELKRPNIKIGEKELFQCTKYMEFIRGKQPDTVKDVKVILISENHKYGPGTKTVVDALVQQDNFEIKSYSDLLTQARSYHKDFICKYEELLEIKNSKNQVAVDVGSEVGPQ